MNTLWRVASVMAVANLLAIVGYVGWLAGTGRLDRDRIVAIRAMLAEPIAQEKARLEEEAKVREAALAQEREAARPAVLPIRADERLRLKLEMSDIDRQRLLALRREVEDLRAGLMRERAMVEAERAAFEAQKADFEATTARLASIEGSAQFKKSVATLNELPAREGIAILLELLGPGAASELDPFGAERVVSYLDAVKPDVRAAIFAQLAKDNPALAAELLERLRTRGLLARGPANDPGP